MPLPRWVESSKQFFTNYANVVFLHRELLHELLNDVVGSKALLREQILDVFGFDPPRSTFLYPKLCFRNSLKRFVNAKNK